LEDIVTPPFPRRSAAYPSAPNLPPVKPIIWAEGIPKTGAPLFVNILLEASQTADLGDNGHMNEHKTNPIIVTVVVIGGWWLMSQRPNSLIQS